jgi:plastocyanin
MASGAEVSVEVSNQDSIEHNFTFAEANANQDVEGGEDATVTFTAPAAGSYEFLCKYHPQAMRGTVTVT